MGRGTWAEERPGVRVGVDELGEVRFHIRQVRRIVTVRTAAVLGSATWSTPPLSWMTCSSTVTVPRSRLKSRRRSPIASPAKRRPRREQDQEPVALVDHIGDSANLVHGRRLPFIGRHARPNAGLAGERFPRVAAEASEPPHRGSGEPPEGCPERADWTDATGSACPVPCPVRRDSRGYPMSLSSVVHAANQTAPKRQRRTANVL